MPLSYRNQSIDLLRKSMDWFLYDNDLRHERVEPLWSQFHEKPEKTPCGNNHLADLFQSSSQIQTLCKIK